MNLRGMTNYKHKPFFGQPCLNVRIRNK